MVSAGVVVVVVDNGTSYKLHLEQLWLLHCDTKTPFTIDFPSKNPGCVAG